MIIFLGPPGSGKGTQAKQLSEKLVLPHISTGDLLRGHIKKGTNLGREAKVFIDEGKLVSDDLIVTMLFDRIAAKDCEKGYILDGYPRRVSQADALQNRLSKEDRLKVFNLEVPDQVIIERITGRLTCRQCGNVQHKVYNPPKTPGICDRCGGELYQRPDDKEEVILKRLAAYKEETEPLIGYYQDKRLLININGNQKPDQVFSDIISRDAKS